MRQIRAALLSSLHFLWQGFVGPSQNSTASTMSLRAVTPRRDASWNTRKRWERWERWRSRTRVLQKRQNVDTLPTILEHSCVHTHCNTLRHGQTRPKGQHRDRCQQRYRGYCCKVSHTTHTHRHEHARANALMIRHTSIRMLRANLRL